MADNTDFFVSIAQQALWITALAAAPFLIPALLTGLLLGMVQAATSINEQTLSFVPKLVVIRSEEHTSELQSLTNLVCRLLLEKKQTRLHKLETCHCQL